MTASPPAPRTLTARTPPERARETANPVSKTATAEVPAASAGGGALMTRVARAPARSGAINVRATPTVPRGPASANRALERAHARIAGRTPAGATIRAAVGTRTTPVTPYRTPASPLPPGPIRVPRAR